MISEELAYNIDRTRKEVTILFTDMVDSTRYWDQYGDIKGRLMVDRHNRLIFPVIRQYRGRVIKTIGDGLMAVFKKPDNALKAAIAIQQTLQKMRDMDRSFYVKVRIGLHTGKSIIERNDIYGDAVNVAKRVESFGGSNEIMLSQHTADRLDTNAHFFHKKGSFIPKGKKKPITIYRCRWSESKDLTRGLKFQTRVLLDSHEKGDVVAYSILGFLALAALYYIYGRFLLADWLSASDFVTLIILNPLLLFTELPFAVACMAAGLLGAILALIWIKTIPCITLKILKGIVGFGFGFVFIYIPVHQLPITFATAAGQEIFASHNAFIRSSYRQVPDELRRAVREQNLYVLMGNEMVWPVAAGGAESGEAAVTAVWSTANLSAVIPSPFYFRLFDLCACFLGLFGFVLGFMNFTIRPS